jgi:glucosylceramidase
VGVYIRLLFLARIPLFNHLQMRVNSFSSLLGILLAVTSLQSAAQKGKMDFWLTKSDRSVLFAKQKQVLSFSGKSNDNPVIEVDDQKIYQVIDGFGYALTGGSAMHMVQMSAVSRKALIKELFAVDGNNIGVSYLRLSIGASDLNEKVFSYDDLPEGEKDMELKQFDLGPDRKDVIPVLKEILAVNPEIKILGSPWSPPAWMKTSYDTRGGMLKPEYFEVYAQYLVRYILEMKKEGIVIDAITIQNEPLHPGNNPSLLMPAPDQAEFIKSNFGPALKKAGLNTKIILYDHNADRPDYPITILNDAAANKYVDGSGFHLYGGKIEALSEVHDAYPDKNIYFTEQMVVERPEEQGINIVSPVRRLIIGATRNWSKNVLLWNLAADPENKPFTDRGGCPMCQGAVTIAKDSVGRNVAYYAIAHASKFVRPGSVRIASTAIQDLSNVAFKTPAGKKVLIVANSGDGAKTFNIRFDGKIVTATLDKGAVATYIW